ncbi:MAG: aminoglycoside phosphotransferase family protein [Kofleriaceae bacterium]
MDDVAIAMLPELGRGRDFIARRHGELVIREPRTERARGKLVVERAVREAIAPAFPTLVAAPIACDLPAPLFAYRWVDGRPIVAPPRAHFVDTFAQFVCALHTAVLPMTVDPAPQTVVRRFQAIVRGRYLPQLPPEERTRYEPAAIADVPGSVTRCPQHGDLAARNLLVDDAGQLVAILDWSDCVISDPAIDFGAIAQWGGADVLDEMLARTGRAADRALRERARIVGVLLSVVDHVHAQGA